MTWAGWLRMEQQGRGQFGRCRALPIQHFHARAGMGLLAGMGHQKSGYGPCGAQDLRKPQEIAHWAAQRESCFPCRPHKATSASN